MDYEKICELILDLEAELKIEFDAVDRQSLASIASTAQCETLDELKELVGVKTSS